MSLGTKLIICILKSPINICARLCVCVCVGGGGGGGRVRSSTSLIVSQTGLVTLQPSSCRHDRNLM